MQENLFTSSHSPLASILRPQNLEEVVGQENLKQALQKMSQPMSLILYGPPGCGKTTIARILSQRWKFPFRALSAISAGVKEVKKVIEEAKVYGKVILFLDEIHRFSASQQDSLLDAVERGVIALVGATTENPGFRINRALLSRLHVHKLQALSKEDLGEILQRGLRHYAGDLQLSESLQEFVLHASGGDARRLLGIVEAVYLLAGKNPLEDEVIRQHIDSFVMDYDKSGENHYDFISAFIKSIRGSDPDAAMYYLACMLEGGEDPLFIARRLVILASEDVGNASVHALPLANAMMASVEKIGMPESSILLAHVTSFLASCPKSNASYMAIKKARSYVKEHGPNVRIPDHLRNAPTWVHRKEGAGQGYKYPHEYPNHFLQQFYFPEDLVENPPQFYFPSTNGQEKTIRERLQYLWQENPFKNYES
ncbi:MAG: replication-associated recombination protein A [Spirochaetota bacterium]